MKLYPQSLKRAKFYNFKKVLKHPREIPRQRFYLVASHPKRRENGLTWNFKVEIMRVKILRPKF